MIYQMHDKHGRHIAAHPHEAKANEKNGWRTVSESEFYSFAKISPEIEVLVDDLEEKYEAKYGKKPHHRMKRENIEAALNDHSE